ncbi:MAG: hypothetical protein Tsb0034_29790 [Ekhidna sp.]
MNFSSLRFLAFGGIIIAMILSIWYTIKTYNEGNPRWIYLIMAFGIAILLSHNIRVGRRKD